MYTPDPTFRFANEIKHSPIDWLWQDRIPLGAFTLLVGDPASGKSLLATDIAARLSTGRNLPTAPKPLDPSIPASPNPSSTGLPFGAIYLSTDDRPEDALVPRLAAADADLSNICILDSLPTRSDLDPSPDPQALIPALAQTVRAVQNPRLLIIDTLPAVLPGGTAPAITLFNALTDFARDYDIAILGTTHLTKSRAHRPLYRVRGTLSYVAAARSVLSIAPDPSDENARVLLSLKSAYGPLPPSLRFVINDRPSLEWDSTQTPACAPDFLDLQPDTQSALLDACEWLRHTLNAGPRPTRKLITEARALGHTLATLRRAKCACAVTAIKPGPGAQWLWTLSEPGNQRRSL